MTTQGNGSDGNGHKSHVDTSVSADSERGASVFTAAPPPGQLTKKDFVSNQEVRWCPGCGESRHSARENGFRFGHRLFLALSLLHEYVRLSQYSWTRARHCHRNKVSKS